MAELNTSTINDMVKLAEVIWVESWASVSQVARESGLFKVVQIPQGTGESREFSEIDLEEYADNKDEADQAGRARVQQGYSKTMYAVRRAKDISITVEMRKRNKYPEVLAKLQSLGKLVPNRMDLDMTHRLTFATATSYTDRDGTTVTTTTGDGFQVAYTAHTLKGSSSTYRNRLAGNARCSKGALEGMERLIAEETLNQFGEKMSMPFDIIFSTDDPNTVNTIREYLQATAAVDAPNSGVPNVYKAKYRHVILPRLATAADGTVDTDKRYYWGLASSQLSSAYVGVWEEAYMLNPMDLGKDSTENWDFGVRGSYGIEIINGTWIKFSTGDGVA